MENNELKLLKDFMNKINSDIYNTSVEEVRKILKDLDNHIIPNDYHILEDNLSLMTVRDVFIEKQGFAMLSKNWIDKLAKWIGERKCLEVMAGCGAFSKVLQDRGISVISTDDFSWNANANWNAEHNYWTDIENLDCISAIKKYGQDVDLVIMSWPPYNENSAYQVLKTLRAVNKDAMIIYIGEGAGGCTADDDFHENLKFVEDDDFYKIDNEYITWYGLHDSLYLIK